MANCGNGAAALGFGIWGIVLLFQFAFAFRRAAKQAPTDAARETPAPPAPPAMTEGAT